MSAYLDRLKRLDDENYFQHTPDIEPTKPSKAPSVGFDGKGTGHVDKIIVGVAIDSPPETDCIGTLETDYLELKTLIGELCQIVGHADECKANMLATCRNLTPAQMAEQRDFFRQQVELATGGRYWNPLH